MTPPERWHALQQVLSGLGVCPCCEELPAYGVLVPCGVCRIRLCGRCALRHRLTRISPESGNRFCEAVLNYAYTVAAFDGREWFELTPEDLAVAHRVMAPYLRSGDES
jgi:hypothetical protein